MLWKVVRVHLRTNQKTPNTIGNVEATVEDVYGYYLGY